MATTAISILTSVLSHRAQTVLPVLKTRPVPLLAYANLDIQALFVKPRLTNVHLHRVERTMNALILWMATIASADAIRTETTARAMLMSAILHRAKMALRVSMVSRSTPVSALPDSVAVNARIRSTPALRSRV
jgi:hypothetical protein